MMEWTEPRLKRLPKAVMKIYEFAVKRAFDCRATKGVLDNTRCRIKSQN